MLIAGVSLAAVTTFLSALGLTLQKASFSGPQADARLQVCGRRLWHVGLALVVVAALVSLAVSALLGQLLASSMAALTLVWAAGARHLLLAERLTRADVVEVLLLVGGTVLIAAGRGQGEAANPPLFSPSLLGDALNSWRTAIYCALFFFSFAALWTSSWRPLVRLPCLMGLAALFGALTGAASKAVGSLLVHAGRNSAIVEVVSSFWLWLCVMILVASVLFQLAYLNAALKEGSAGVVVPC